MSFINQVTKKTLLKGNVIVPTIIMEQEKVIVTEVPKTKGAVINGKAEKSKSKRANKKRETEIKRSKKADKLRRKG